MTCAIRDTTVDGAAAYRSSAAASGRPSDARRRHVEIAGAVAGHAARLRWSSRSRWPGTGTSASSPIAERVADGGDGGARTCVRPAVGGGAGAAARAVGPGAGGLARAGGIVRRFRSSSARCRPTATCSSATSPRRATASCRRTLGRAARTRRCSSAAGLITQDHELFIALQVDERRAGRASRSARPRAARRRARRGVRRADARDRARSPARFDPTDVVVEGVLSPPMLARAIRLAFDPYGRERLNRLAVARGSAGGGSRGVRADRRRRAVGPLPDRRRHAPDLLGRPMAAAARRAAVPDAAAARRPRPSDRVSVRRRAGRRRARRAAPSRRRSRATRRTRSSARDAGFRTTARSAASSSDAALRREEELAAGHEEIRFAGYVTVSGRDDGRARRACERVEQAAQQAYLELQPLWGEQDAGFVHGALPVARGLSAARPLGGAAVRRRLAERDGHRATTANAQAIYPFVAEGGLGGRGVYIGTRPLRRLVLLRPVGALRAARAHQPEHARRRRGRRGQVVAGQDATSSARRVFGRRPWIVDPKGEYAPLARALGVEPIRLVPAARVRLNPLAARRRLGAPAEPAARGRRRRARAPAGARGGGALREALRVLDATQPAEPTLPGRRRAAAPPDRRDGGRARHHAAASSPRRARERRSALAAAVRGRPARDVRRPDDAGPRPRRAASSCSTSRRSTLRDALGHPHDLRRGLAARRDRSTARRGRRDGVRAPKVIVVVDEAWRVLSVSASASGCRQRSSSRARTASQNVVVMHRLSDLAPPAPPAAASARSPKGCCTTPRRASSTARPRTSVPRTRELLGLTVTEAELLPELGRGVALWKVGRRSFLVQHRLVRRERRLVDTDAACSTARGAAMSTGPHARAWTGSLECRSAASALLASRRRWRARGSSARPRRAAVRRRLARPTLELTMPRVVARAARPPRRSRAPPGRPARRSSPGPSASTRRSRSLACVLGASPACSSAACAAARGRRRAAAARWARARDLRGLRRARGLTGASRSAALGGHLVAAEPRQSVIVVAPTQSGQDDRPRRPGDPRVGRPGPRDARSRPISLRDTLARRAQRRRGLRLRPDRVTGLARAGWTPLAGCTPGRRARETAARLCRGPPTPARGIERRRLLVRRGGELPRPAALRRRQRRPHDGRRRALGRHRDQDSSAGARRPAFSLEQPRRLATHEPRSTPSRRSGAATTDCAPRSYTTAAVALDAYADPAVARCSRAADIDAPTGCSTAANTAYLCAHGDDQRRLRPLFVDAHRRDRRAASTTAPAATGEPLDPPLLVVLDEAANIAPLPDLDQLASTGAGQGIQLVTVVQDLAQLDARWARGPTRSSTTTAPSSSAPASRARRPSPTSPACSATKPIAQARRPAPSTAAARAPRARTTGALAPADGCAKSRPATAVLLYGHLPPARIQLRPWYADRDLRRLARTGGAR